LYFFSASASQVAAALRTASFSKGLEGSPCRWAEAAGAQGKFWETDTLFERQNALRTKDLIRYGEELTLDVDRFREELKNETYRERVRADFLAGVQHGWTARLLVSEWRPLR